MTAMRNSRLLRPRRRRRRGHGLALAAGLLLCPALALAQTTPPAGPAGAAQQAAPAPEQIDKRLLSVSKLIEHSSVSRQIEASGDAGALAQHAKAREAYAQARRARDAGDYAKAARLATESSTLMFGAARLAGAKRVTEDKWRADFAARLQSVRALVATQQRISAEKPGAVDAAETLRRIEELIGEANRLAAANQPPQAENVLNKAYLLAKAAVSSMRDGDTLVRSLNFATPEEEYRYELDRNETHLMLIKVLSSEKSRIHTMEEMLNRFSDKATQLRSQAEKASATGDYAQAIELLEGSTRELVRAIRSLGIFIPG